MTQPLTGSDATSSADLKAAWTFVWTSSDASTRGWLQGMQPVTMHDSLVILAVANEFTRDRVETRMRPLIEDQLSQFYSRPIRLAIDVDPSLGDDIVEPALDEEPAPVEHLSPSPAPSRPAGGRPAGRPGQDRVRPERRCRWATRGHVHVGDRRGRARAARGSPSRSRSPPHRCR